MNDDLVTAAERLAEVLERENGALEVLDLAKAANLVPAKRLATQALAAARASAVIGPEPSPLVEVTLRLRGLAEENRRLLERAITVQSRVIGVIARAMPPPTGARYAPSGALTQGARSLAFALSARA
jgi:hypothetical protein